MAGRPCLDAERVLSRRRGRFGLSAAHAGRQDDGFRRGAEQLRFE
tara:strand:- start:318 stop:452 length:135 start_codon:yes stop_codon:yes gene_type:complete